MAESGGDFTSVVAALDSITDAGPENRYVVKIGPGIYTETVTLKSWVDLEGSGQDVTVLRSTGGIQSPYVNINAVTLYGQGNIASEVRFLSVESVATTQSRAYAIFVSNVPAETLRFTHVTARAVGGSVEAVAILNQASSPVLTHLNVVATGTPTSLYGISNVQGSSPLLAHTAIHVTGAPGGGTGIHNNNSAPTLQNVRVKVELSAGNAVGIYSTNTSAPIIRHTQVVALGSNSNGIESNNAVILLENVDVLAEGTVSGSGNVYGIYNFNARGALHNVHVIARAGNWNRGIFNNNSANEILLHGVTALAEGPGQAWAVFNQTSAAVHMNDVTAIARDGSDNYGLYNASVSTSFVRNSLFSGATHSIYIAGANSPVHVAHTQLVGTVTGVAAGYTCLGVYDQSFAPLDGDCR